MKHRTLIEWAAHLFAVAMILAGVTMMLYQVLRG